MPPSFALATATAGDFAPHVGSEFALASERDTAPALTLTGVSEAGRTPEGQRPPFSLLLAGPPAPALPQGTYLLTHPILGVFDLFLVPVGADAVRRSYQAVFN